MTETWYSFGHYCLQSKKSQSKLNNHSVLNIMLSYGITLQ